VTPERARVVYRVLLRLVPRRLRRRHAGDMEALFLDHLNAARERGGNAEMRAWAHATGDVLGAAVREPLRRRSRTPKSPQERRTKMVGSDLRYALRSLMRQRLSTTLVVSMLAVAMAANIVVFSLVNGLLLRPFPFPDPERLVAFNETAPRMNLDVVGINYPDFEQWRKNARVFEGLALYDTLNVTVSDERGAERVVGASVTYDFAAVVGIRPVIGRMFTAEEDRPKAPPVVVIGQQLWRDRFGQDPNVVGRTIRLNSVPSTIIGVLPPEADFPGEVRLWVPRAGDPNQPYQSYGGNGIARLRRGVSLEDAQKDLMRAHGPIFEARDKERIVTPFVRSLRDEYARDFRTVASMLLAAVGLLLLVACANVTSVMLARALARRREMGIRLAIGASRGRLVAQLFVENLVLATVGGSLGLTIGYAGLRALIAAMGTNVPMWTRFEIDGRVLAFSVAVCAVAALLFGWAPALHAVRGSVRGAMQSAGTGTTGAPGGRRTLSLLVGAEFALATVLIVCGGLLLRAYDRVRHVEPGFRPDHVFTFAVSLPEATYPNEATRLAFWTRLQERSAAVAAVESVGIVSCPPLGCHWGTFYLAEGAAPRAPGQANPVVLYRLASDDYVRAMGLTLKSGRWFDPRDAVKDAPRVVVVNETFARTFWPGVTDPVGRRIKGTGKTAPWMTVVGLVRDVKHYGLEQPMRPALYQPLAVDPLASGTVALRTAVEPESIATAMRTLVHRLDPDLALFRVQTMEQALRQSVRQRAVYSWMLGVFAALAFVLALGGTYGVTSYLVTQRVREIGIRVALGAASRHIVSAVIRSSAVAVGGGVLLGVAASIGAARLLSALLFGVPPHDAVILTGSAVVLLTAALVANLLPARRAARVDPMTSLRAD
jgi:predicted permease